MEELEKAIQAKRDEINSHYWRFTRTARGKPPPARLYQESIMLENKLAELKKKPMPTPTKPLTARAVWDAYVAQHWLPPVERPLGRRGNTITTENPNAHLARDLRYKSYDNGRYVIECCDANRTAWAKRMLTHSLAVNLTTFARALGVEREVSVEFVTRKETEKF